MYYGDQIGVGFSLHNPLDMCSKSIKNLSAAEFVGLRHRLCGDWGLIIHLGWSPLT